MSYAEAAHQEVLRELREIDRGFRSPTLAMETMAYHYTLLAIVKGEETTSKDVHDAWSMATFPFDPTHRSLVPFEELTEEVQAYDDVYRDAIVRVAARLKA